MRCLTQRPQRKNYSVCSVCDDSRKDRKGRKGIDAGFVVKSFVSFVVFFTLCALCALCDACPTQTPAVDLFGREPLNVILRRNPMLVPPKQTLREKTRRPVINMIGCGSLSSPTDLWRLHYTPCEKSHAKAWLPCPEPPPKMTSKNPIIVSFCGFNHHCRGLTKPPLSHPRYA